MKILVTGAGGFMGSHLFDYLRAQGHDVVGLDNYSIGTYEHEDIYRVDLTDKGYTEFFIQEKGPFELVYHLAAWAHEGLSQFAPLKITENNYNAFLNLIVPLINNGLKKIVVFSSMSVYGDQKPPFDEDMKKKPVDIYAVAKASMEDAVAILSKVHDFEYTIIRPHNVYGERQALHDPYRNVVGIFMNRIMQDKPPIIYGDGHQTRAFTYVGDVTPYVARAGFLDLNKQIINIGPTEEYSINELANTVLSAMDSKLIPIHMADRPQEVKHAFCTNDKAVKLLGYRTSTPFVEGIQRMADWAKQIGSKPFIYMDKLELEGENTPRTWTEKLM